MKQAMKIGMLGLLSTLMLLPLAASAQLSFQLPDELRLQQIKVVLTRETSELALQQMIEELAEDGIILKVKQEKRTSGGELKAVKGTIKFPDGAKTTFESKKMGRVVIQRKKIGEGPISVKVKAGRNLVEWIR